MKTDIEKKKRSNIVLIGMPGAGKSTIGVLLAKYLALDFVDTDLMIQVKCGEALQKIVDTQGYMELRSIEEKVILTLVCANHVIATGGSAVYSPTAMAHLKKNAATVFLDSELTDIERRIADFDTRGIARKVDQTFDDLFRERLPLYQLYADITIDCRNKNQDEITAEICAKLKRP
ncbi:MAG: shikimate kinase [Proteobacteria bacterium]|nr:shikimate kinase [Pseudomonadota bacterium]